MRYALEARQDGEIVHRRIVADGRAEKYRPLKRIVFSDGHVMHVDLVPLRAYERIVEIDGFTALLSEAAKSKTPVVSDVTKAVYRMRGSQR